MSRAGAGTKGNWYSDDPAISADGRRVAFESAATTLDDDADPSVDVFVRDVEAGTTRLVSRATGAQGANSDVPAQDPAISADGLAVSYLSEVTTPDARSEYQVDVRRLDDLTTTRVAPGAAASLSGDGSCVMFSSDSPAVVRSSPDYERALLRAVRGTCNLEQGQSGGQGDGGAQGGQGGQGGQRAGRTPRR